MDIQRTRGENMRKEQQESYIQDVDNGRETETGDHVWQGQDF